MLPLPLVCLATTVAIVLSAATLDSQAPPQTRTDYAWEASAKVHRNLLALKLSDKVGVEFDSNELRSRAGLDLSSLQRILDRATAVRPMVTGVPRQLLDDWHAAARTAKRPGPPPGHLAHWFFVEGASAAHTDQLREELRAHPLVVHCYREPIPVPASAGASMMPGDPLPPTPSYTSMQGNLGSHPNGTELRWANGILGARGRGVKIRMIEEDWVLDHEDISQLVSSNFLGTVPPGTGNDANHGVAGTSLMVADRNRWGLTGASDEVDIRFIAFPQSGGLVNAMITAAADEDPGDVILMVVMLLLPPAQGGIAPNDWVPYEYVPAVFDAVATTTAVGRIFVATCANGGRSLDDPRFGGAFNRSLRDSGAIFVGATDGVNLVRASFSNFGNIVDSHCWGENVVAAGFGGLFFGNNDPRQAYTSTYAGTSASTPILASCVAALQGAAQQQLGQRFTGTEVRTLLQTHGTTVSSIGRRPDMRAIFAATGILDGLELSEPDLMPGNSLQVTVSQPGTIGGALLFASLGTGNTDLGFNRAIHLDLAGTTTLDFLPLLGGQANFTVAVPNSTALSDVQLYLQAAILPVAGPLFVTNSGHLTVL